MAKYALLRTFQARCRWSIVFDDPQVQSPENRNDAIRTITYQFPNRFKIRSEVLRDHYVATSISDGKQVIEFENEDKSVAWKFPAPPSISEVTSTQMLDQLDCGSLLYQFFGGPTRLASLVKMERQPIRFGPDIVVDGVKCRTVQFYAQQLFGHATVAISLPDHLVRRIIYHSEPKVKLYAETTNMSETPQVTTETYDRMSLNQDVEMAACNTTLPDGVQVRVLPPLPDKKPPVAIGQLAPDFTVLSLTDGHAVRLSYRRGRLILLNFSATWSSACQESLPVIQKLSQQYGAHDLDVMTMDDEDSATIRPFLTEKGYTFPVYLDAYHSASSAFHVTIWLPTMAIIDQQGRLAAWFVGAQKPAVILSALKKAGLNLNP